ncbi:unnamed protein product [Amoebophrya sp. A25]|nr:unnamed protein product [Amoebophrya sp. A25]|eukprot:GSA25T00006276001.1
MTGTFALLLERTGKNAKAQWKVYIQPPLVYGLLSILFPFIVFKPWRIFGYNLGFEWEHISHGTFAIGILITFTVVYLSGLREVAVAASGQVITDKEDKMLDVLRVYGATPFQYWSSHLLAMFLLSFLFLGLGFGSIPLCVDFFVTGPPGSAAYANAENLSIPSYWMETAYPPLLAGLLAVVTTCFAGCFLGLVLKDAENLPTSMSIIFNVVGLAAVLATVLLDLTYPTRTSWIGMSMSNNVIQKLLQPSNPTPFGPGLTVIEKEAVKFVAGQFSALDEWHVQNLLFTENPDFLGRTFEEWRKEPQQEELVAKAKAKWTPSALQADEEGLNKALRSHENGADGEKAQIKLKVENRITLELYDHYLRSNPPHLLWRDDRGSPGAPSTMGGMVKRSETLCPDFFAWHTFLNVGVGFLAGTFVPGIAFFRIMWRGAGFVWVRHSGLNGKVVFECASAHSEDELQKLKDEGVFIVPRSLASKLGKERELNGEKLPKSGKSLRALLERHFPGEGVNDGALWSTWKDFVEADDIKPHLLDLIPFSDEDLREVGRLNFEKNSFKEVARITAKESDEQKAVRAPWKGSKDKDPHFKPATEEAPYRDPDWWEEATQMEGWGMMWGLRSKRMLTASPRDISKTGGWFDSYAALLGDYLAVLLNALLWGGAIWYYDRRRLQAETGVVSDANGSDTHKRSKVLPAGLNDEDFEDTSHFPLLQQQEAGAAGSGGNALELRGLTKRFQKVGREFLANDNVTFNVKTAEIFGLLGHNGAGKTTLLSQITGLIPLSEGDAVIAGESVRFGDLRKVQENIAFCPQNNPMLGANFTLREHVTFFSRLRGYDEAETAASVAEYAKGLGLTEKLDTRCEELSGGQKRRMWVMCAFLGKAPLLLLDEPTSGMDPQARRDFWVMLKQMAREHNRAVVFSTHYLEEADLLAERKVILAAGQVKALGTSAELKRKFGAGYWINASIDEESSTMQDEATTSSSTPPTRMKEKDAREHLRKFGQEIIEPQIKGMKTRNPKVSGFFLSYSVPWNEVGNLPALLDKIDAELGKYKISNYSVEMTTLEEVFLRIGHDTDQEQGTAVVSEEQRARDIAVGRLPLRPRERSFFREVSAIWHLRCSGLGWMSFLLPAVRIAFVLYWVISSNKALTLEKKEKTPSDWFAAALLSYSPTVIAIILGTPLAVWPTTSAMTLVYHEVAEIKVLAHAQRHGLRRVGYFFGNALFFFTTTGLGLASLLWGTLVVISADLPAKHILALEEGSSSRNVFYAKWLLGPPIASICALLVGMQWGGCGSRFLTVFVGMVVSFGMIMSGAPPFYPSLKGAPGGAFAGSGWMPSVLFLPQSIGISANGISLEQLLANDPFAKQLADAASGTPSSEEAGKATYESYDAFTGGLYAILLAIPASVFTFFVVDYLANWPTKSQQVNPAEWPTDDVVVRGGRNERDSAVVEEENRVKNQYQQGNYMINDQSGTHDADAVVVSDVRKRFYNPNGTAFWATRGVSLGVKRGECFGLLGPNGAGKSTLFNLITGDSETGGVSSGKILIKGQDCYADNFSVASKIGGLAPQFDKLWPKMSGIAHLRFYARVAGTYYPPAKESNSNKHDSDSDEEDTERLLGGPFHKDYGEDLIERTLRDVSLSMKDADMPTETYSGGMKRKLSVALTMVTEPEVVFLDEMSAGVDLGAQRYLWNKLIHRPAGQTIISTTHSMMEADATCDRVGILVRGRLECLGRTEQIKEKYGSGYHLEISIPKPEGPQPGEKAKDLQESLCGSVEDLRAQDIILLEELSISETSSRLTFELHGQKGKKLKLAPIFRWCLKKQESGELIEYGLGQPTLEQVFLRFARIQEQFEAGVVAPTDHDPLDEHFPSVLEPTQIAVA